VTAPTVAPEVTAADLRNAAEAIRRHGWGRGQFWSRDNGCLCLVGAIATAVYGRVPVVPGVAAKPMWMPSRLLLPSQKDRAKAAETAVTRYIRRHNLLDGDPDEIDINRNYDAVDWNDEECSNGEQAARLMETIADELAAVA
jgi:hypothetical protein